jgi:hypothetical protein
LDVPAASLQAKASKIRSEAAASNIFSLMSGQTAGQEGAKNPELAKRAYNHFANQLLKGQKNREAVIIKTIDDLKAIPPQEDAMEEINEDWLTMFSKIAEQKSNEDVQLLLSKILSGEIRRPGSFSPKTINILAYLGPRQANQFLKVCALTFSYSIYENDHYIISPPIQRDSQFNDYWINVDLSYETILELQDIGLISATQFSLPFVYSELLKPFSVGCKKFVVESIDHLTDKSQGVRAYRLSSSGSELSFIMRPAPNDSYQTRFLNWMADIPLIPKEVI